MAIEDWYRIYGRYTTFSMEMFILSATNEENLIVPDFTLQDLVFSVEQEVLTGKEVKVVHVSIEEAKSMTSLALKMIAWDDEDTALQAEIMTAVELCGNNQGLVKQMYQPSLMAPSPGSAKPTIKRETPRWLSSMQTKHQECSLQSLRRIWLLKKPNSLAGPSPL